MKHWLTWLVLGVLSIIFGFVVLGNTVIASIAIAKICGILLIVSGAAQIIGGFSAETTVNKLTAIAMGIILVFLGVSFTFEPLRGMISLTMLIIILLGASGVLRIIYSWGMRGKKFFWPTLISGIFSLCLAFYLWSNFAVSTATLLGMILGIELLFNGVGLVAIAFHKRSPNTV